MFGSNLNLDQLLPSEAVADVVDFLRVIKAINPDVRFAPMIPPVAVLLLLLMEPPLAALSLQAMIEKSKSSQHREAGWFLATDSESFAASVMTFVGECRRNAPRLMAWAETELGVCFVRLLLKYLPSMFLPAATLPAALTLFDAFVGGEGRKVLWRLYVALIVVNKAELRQARSADDFVARFRGCVGRLAEPASLQGLLHAAYGLHMTRDMSVEASLLMDFEGLDKAGEELQPIIDPRPVPSLAWRVPTMLRYFAPLRCKSGTMRDLSHAVKVEVDDADEVPVAPRMANLGGARATLFRLPGIGRPGHVINDGPLQRVTCQLTTDMFHQLATYFPQQVRSYSAVLVFQAPECGTMFANLISSGSSPGYYLLVVQCAKRLIGAFLSEALQFRPESYGRPSTFVFQIVGGQARVFESAAEGPRAFLRVMRHELHVGGPEPAIFLVDGFQRIFSRRCATFASEPLTDDEQVGDAVVSLELYRLQLPPR